MSYMKYKMILGLWKGIYLNVDYWLHSSEISIQEYCYSYNENGR
jgi:hypothetical protein